MTKGTLFWSVWALVPVAVIGLHMGLGKPYAQADRASAHIRAALNAENEEDWATAAAEYAKAEPLLDASMAKERRTVSLARAKARMKAGEYIEGQEQLDQLLDEAIAKTPDDRTFIELMRTEVASAAYYAAWAMRLEGGSEEEWLPESEIARQQYRLLAENAQRAPQGDGDDVFGKNLEAVVRFQRMTIEEVRAMGMPKDCKNGGMCKGKKNQRQSKSKQPAPPKDAREKVKSAGGAGTRGTGW